MQESGLFLAPEWHALIVIKDTKILLCRRPKNFRCNYTFEQLIFNKLCKHF